MKTFNWHFLADIKELTEFMKQSSGCHLVAMECLYNGCWLKQYAMPEIWKIDKINEQFCSNQSEQM